MAAIHTNTSQPAEPTGALIATAFTSLDVAAWLVPDPGQRHRILTGQFTMLAAHAADHGRIDTATDPTGALIGVAVWFDRTGPLPEIPDYQARLASLCGPHLPRITALDTAMDAAHPTTPHHHLAFLAVAPGHQRHGIGTALLRAGHDRLDAAGIPAYLEAADEHSRALYARCGYRDLAPLRLPDGGPVMWPMWRTPAPPPS